MKRSLRNVLCVTAGVLAGVILAGCRVDGTGTKMQWAPDMADTPTAKPQKTFLDPPEGSVPMRSLVYQKTPEEAEQLTVMPADIAGDPQATEKGRDLFETFCTVCHNSNAKGGMGSLGPLYVPTPDLTLDVYKARGDGFFFHRITFGSAIMPAYGHAISASERWMIVKHLRTLQKAGQ